MKLDIAKVLKILSKTVDNYDAPVVDLVAVSTNDVFKILIATMLSARTRDEVTSRIVKKLFTKIRKVSDIKGFSQKEVENMIRPVGFYKTKARHLKMLPRIMHEEFNDMIPSTVEELVKLPGVGRKTANLVVAIGFHKPAICVDTHVHRIMNRLGYVNTKNPLETEMALRKKLPKRYWFNVNSILVAFGQNVCRPISPYCSQCPIKDLCNRVGVVKSR